MHECTCTHARTQASKNESEQQQQKDANVSSFFVASVGLGKKCCEIYLVHVTDLWRGNGTWRRWRRVGRGQGRRMIRVCVCTLVYEDRCCNLLLFLDITGSLYGATAQCDLFVCLGQVWERLKKPGSGIYGVGFYGRRIFSIPFVWSSGRIISPEKRHKTIEMLENFISHACPGMFKA